MTNDFIDITPLISLTSMPYATAGSVISKYSIEAYNYTIAKHIHIFNISLISYIKTKINIM